MKRPMRVTVRTIAAAVLVAAASISCPNPIDEELLLVVDDATPPVIQVVSPAQNSLYRYAVDISGTATDFSGATGTGLGFVRTLAFSVSGNVNLARTIAFERDGGFTVTPPDPTFAYTPATGAFSFTVDTTGLDGMQFFTFVLEDLNGNVSQQLVTLLQDPVGPALTVTAPVNGSSWPLLMTVSGTAVNQDGATTGDRIAKLTTGIAGLVHELDLTLLVLQGDGRYHGTAPADSFWFEPATGDFSDRFSLSGAPPGDKQLRIDVQDDRGMTTTTFLNLFDNNTGPVIVMDDATHPCPDIYSSAVTTAITILGWVDPSNLQPGTTQYIIESPSWQRNPVPIVAGVDLDPVTGEFSFTFNPRAVPALHDKLTVHVYAKDSADRTTHATHFVFDDPDDPGGTFTVASGATWAGDPATTLTFTISDGASGMDRMRFNNDGGAWSGWTAYDSAPLAWTLAATNGTRTVNAEFSDRAGNVYPTSDTIFLDTVEPTVSFGIDGGAGYTQSRSVTLQITASDPVPASGVTEMRFHNDGEAWTGWEAWTASKAWTIRDQDGTRTVYAEVRDAAGNIRAVSDGIVLDRGDPSISTFTINGGDAWTGDRNVTLTLSATDATSSVVEMRFNNDGGGWSGWESYAGSRAWTLANSDGASRQVNVEVRDSAGNVGSAGDTIGLDRSNPSITTFTINGGDASTDTLSVTLTIAATDNPLGSPYQMQFSNDGTTWSGWESFSTSRSWTLESGAAGGRTVRIQVNDRVGHTDSASDGITYSP
jgi:hypothetical protein